MISVSQSIVWWLISDISHCRYLARDNTTKWATLRHNFTVAISPILSYRRSLVRFVEMTHCRYLFRFVVLS